MLIPFLIALAAKIAGAFFVYSSMNIGVSGTFWSDPQKVYSWEQNAVFLQGTGNTGKWPLTFLGWDSAWYLNILSRGYAFSPQTYAFSPGVPFFGAAFNTILQNPMVSLVVTTLIFGVLWIPLYQLFAEFYMGKRAALASALLLAFSPYLFVFTTVAYSEGVFLFFTLSTWYLFKKGKVAYSSVLAAVTALTRIVGVLVILPMLFGSLKQKSVHRLRNVILSLLPIAALVLWFMYCGFTANDLLAPVHTTEWTGLYSLRTLLLEGIPQKGIQAILAAPYQYYPIPTHWHLPAGVVCALVIPLFLFRKAWKMDKSLAIYSLASYFGILLFGALVSTPRFISVLFPLWIPLTAGLSLNKKSLVFVTVVAGVFYVVALSLWISFLNGQFIA